MAERCQPLSPTIELDAVTKCFEAKWALDHITVAIQPGEFVAVVGKSGAGKTTLLRCLACSTTVSEGRIRFGEQDLATLQGTALRRHRARVGMIYQQFNSVKRLRVLDNVLVGRLPHLAGWRRWAALWRYFDATQRATALRCLDHVGLLDRVWQRTDTLSGGEQQRVAIAKILAQEPEVVLADEPVASLDVMNGALVMDSLQRIATVAGLTVIGNLHHVEYAHRYADRVLGLRGGRLVFDGPPAALTEAALADIFGEIPADVSEPSSTAVGEVLWTTSSAPEVGRRWTPILTQLSKDLGIPVKQVASTDYRGSIEALRFNKAQIGQLGPKGYIEASNNNYATVEPIVQLQHANGSVGYRSSLIVHGESDLFSPEDIAGKTLAISPDAHCYKGPSPV